MTDIDHEKIIRALDRAREKLAVDLGDPDEADLRIRSLVNLAVTAQDCGEFAKLANCLPPSP